ncbi:hypothetical protein [Lentibacillus saliphilus]|uniref:hypothetical protein n=1 Tax=Lentibacillus saliphilus TaxID=2737028 RepID=UPI001C2F3248|nr:hypothetical protein [Lentibacillus saliphilus]
MVNYLRGKNIKGCAVISPNSKAGKGEYLEALKALLEYVVSMGSILSRGGERANANMDAFITMQYFLSNVLNDVGDKLTLETKHAFEFCLERVDLILKLQDRLIDICQKNNENADQYFKGELSNFTKEDMEEAVNDLGEIDYIQYKQLMAIYEYIPKFKHIRDLKNKDVDRLKTASVKKYILEFSKGEKEQLHTLKSIEFQPYMDTLTKEQHIEGAKSDFYKNLAQGLALTKKELRYP